MVFQKKELIFRIFLLFFLFITSFSFVFAQQINPGTVDFKNYVSDKFLTEDDVYFSSNFACTNDKIIDLYIVENKGVWNGNDKLIDVRGTPQEVRTDSNARINKIKIWEKPEIGEYDIILDCNSNGLYDSDPILEPIDGFSSVGFSVFQFPGKIFVSKTDVKNISWQYDPEIDNFPVEILKFYVLVQQEDVLLNSFEFKSHGNGSSLDIDNIILYEDINKNGIVDSTDKRVSEGLFDNENNSISLSFDYLIKENQKSSFILFYLFNSNARSNFYVEFVNCSGLGQKSQKKVYSLSESFNSSFVNVLEPKTCLGFVNFRFLKNPVNGFESVDLIVNNLTNCSQKIIKIQDRSCSEITDTKCSCIFDLNNCSCSFKSGNVSSDYWACVDKNDDGDYLDIGESYFTKLNILYNESKSDNSTEDISKINGLVSLDNQTLIVPHENKDNGESEIPRFYVLLEVTLLLILILLFLIFISLNKKSKDNKKDLED